MLDVLTASRLFVRVVVAVLVSVAQLRLIDALGPFVRATLWAQVFARTSQRGTVELVAAVVTVGVSVALVVERDAQTVAAPKLSHVTRSEILVWHRGGGEKTKR